MVNLHISRTDVRTKDIVFVISSHTLAGSVNITIIVKTIILSHEEDIYVTSRDGVTEFSFTLPKAPNN